MTVKVQCIDHLLDLDLYSYSVGTNLAIHFNIFYLKLMNASEC